MILLLYGDFNQQVNKMDNVIGITKDTEIPEKSSKELYLELLYCVEEKHENETRHETAKRLLTDAQNKSEACGNG